MKLDACLNCFKTPKRLQPFQPLVRLVSCSIVFFLVKILIFGASLDVQPQIQGASREPFSGYLASAGGMSNYSSSHQILILQMCQKFSQRSIKPHARFTHILRVCLLHPSLPCSDDLQLCSLALTGNSLTSTATCGVQSPTEPLGTVQNSKPIHPIHSVGLAPDYALTRLRFEPPQPLGEVCTSVIFCML